jgi:hypothetical protein
MRSVLGYTIALIVGHDDDAMGCIVGIFCRILASIITSGHEYCKVLVTSLIPKARNCFTRP